MEIKISGNLDVDMAKKIATQLHESKGAEQLAINMSNIGFVYPFSSLFLLSAIWSTIEHRESCKLTSLEVKWDTTNQACTYLGYFGFFRQLGIDFGKENNGKVNDNFIPIIQIKLKSLKATAEESGVPIQEIIQKKSGRNCKNYFTRKCI